MPDPVSTEGDRPSRDTLAAAARAGARWSAVAMVVRQSLTLLTTAILARFLFPEDFGLMGMAWTVINLLTLGLGLGTGTAIVQRKHLDDDCVSSIFWLTLFVGISLGVVFFLLSWPASWAFAEPRIRPYLQVMSVLFLLYSINIIYQGLLQRSMRFDRLATLEIVGAVCGAAGAIAAAVSGLGVWALVIQEILRVLAMMSLAYGFVRWVPRLHFSRQDLKGVLSFGLNLVGYNFTNYVSRNIDYLLIGRFLGPSPLGLYSMGYNIIVFPVTRVAGILGRVLVSWFSRLQDEDDALRRHYAEVIGVIAFVSFPIMLGLEATARPFVLTLLGEKWERIVPLLLILAPVGMMQSVIAVIGTLFQAKGRTDLQFRWGLFIGTLVAAGIALGLRWGLVGIAAGYAVAHLPICILGLYLPRRLIGLPVRSLLGTILRPLFASGLMMCAVLALRASWFSRYMPILDLGLSVLVGIAAYALLSALTNRDGMASAYAMILTPRTDSAC